MNSNRFPYSIAVGRKHLGIHSRFGNRQRRVQGEIVEEIALPVLGLLTDVDAWTLSSKRQGLLAAVQERGCAVSDAYMFLSFITLAAIPAFAITDKGYVDVLKQELIDPVLSYT